jgi:DNA-binding NtrC family response regulator
LAWIEDHRPEDRADCGAQDERLLVEEFARLNLIGRSPAFLAVLRTIRRAARSTAPIMLEGATGTGKELAARAIHYLGARRGGPFIPVNCGAIPDTLIESELYGHEKGAFTGAASERIGMVALARGGTLFLDEVDTLSSKAQVVLLRFLQDQRYCPLGGRKARTSDARIVAASNADLSARVASGDFRQDLLFRLAVVTLQLPPLRERMGDVELLARHILRLLSAQYDEPKSIDMAALQLLAGHDWPGNVRELENALHRAFVIAPGPVLGPGDFRLGPAPPRSEADSWDPGLTDLPLREAKARLVASFEKRYLRRVLQETRGNVTLAASRAGKERRALGKLLKKHAIETRRAADASPGTTPAAAADE